MNTTPRLKVRVLQRYRAPAGRVFDAWLDSKRAGRWLFATATCPMAQVKIDARVGGSFSFVDGNDARGVEYVGEYLEIVRPRRLVFTLAMESRPRAVTRVTVEIEGLKSGCELRLLHENVPSRQAIQAEKRWTGVLYGLGETLGAAS
ncbi:MAG: SRPBCC family protein [Burkholderiales bacterium]